MSIGSVTMKIKDNKNNIEQLWTNILKWNQTSRDYPLHQDIDDLFMAQVTQRPDKTAITAVSPALTSASQFTYAQLAQASIKITQQLQHFGIEPNTLVGVYGSSSSTFIASLLAILKANGTYLTLNPNYPDAHLTYLLHDAQPHYVLIAPESLDRFPLPYQLLFSPPEKSEFPLPAIVSLSFPNAPLASPFIETLKEHLAYVIYTSGTTGRPKGVMILQRALLNHALAIADLCQLLPDDNVLQFADISFDVSNEEIFPTLCSGGNVVIRPPAPVMILADLITLIREFSITVLNLPTSYWHEWVTYLEYYPVPDTVRLLLVGSEAMLGKHLTTWQEKVPHVPVWHAYGVAEATITSTIYQPSALSNTLDHNVPIGRPVTNTYAYILDQDRYPVPVGMVGELYLGGAALGHGYLNLPGITQKRFLPLEIFPFATFLQNHGLVSNIKDEKLYRTGDLASYLPDGNIEFHGREDDQVNIRGHRVELNHIINALIEHPAVQDVLVLPHEHKNGSTYLIAYFVVEDDQERIKALKTELYIYAQQRLPAYMIPHSFIYLNSFPLTINSKVDLKALPLPETMTTHERAVIPPQNDTERKLAEIWMRLLSCETIDREDDFFSLGGDSLLVARLIHEIVQLFGVRLDIHTLLKNPVLCLIAAQIEQNTVSPAEEINFMTEISLDAAITPPTLYQYQPQDTWQAVLLTGATGFLGTYLLSELLKQTEARVYCLVRASTLAEAMERLQIALSQRGLWDKQYGHRIEPLLGDLQHVNWGLSEKKFAQLAVKIDVIYHNGAWVNHIYPYDILKPANVLGTKTVLKLASTTRTKPVHYISTISVFSAELEKVMADTPLQKPEILVNGYAQTKWVSEALLQKAKERGVPVTVYRPSRLIVPPPFSAKAHADDIFQRTLQTYTQLGTIGGTAESEENILPIDWASRAVVTLSTQPQAHNKKYHLVHPQNITLEYINNALQQLGYPPYQYVPLSQWYKQIVDQKSSHLGLHHFIPYLVLLDFTNVPEQFTYEYNLQADLPATMPDPVALDQTWWQTYLSNLQQIDYLASPTKKAKRNRNNSLIPHFPEFVPLEMAHQTLINTYLAELPPYSDHTFTSLWCW
jgi:amino acid adenylation domain-containing protein/thioester reductase-like protein